MRLLRLYTGFQFFFGLLLWLPIFFAYQEKMGLTAAEIFQIQSLYQIIFCFLEIPTGWYADRKGYLSSIRLGATVLITANLLPIFAVSYSAFLLHFSLIALSRSFISGASSAYLYEALRERGETYRYKEIEGAARTYGLFGKVLGWAGVGYLMQWHITLPYWTTSLASLIALGYALVLPQLTPSLLNSSDHPIETRPSFLEAFKLLLKELRSQRALWFVMLQGIAIFVLSRILQVTLFQPILTSKSLSLGSHGLVMSAMTVFEAVGSWKPHWARRWLSDWHAISWMTIGIAGMMMILPWANASIAVAALCASSLLVGWSFPVQKQIMNDTIQSSHRRATLLSIESIMDRGISALATLLLASYMASGRMNDFLVHSAIATFVAIAMIALLGKDPARQNTNLPLP